jgi:hypothetical protein
LKLQPQTENGTSRRHKAGGSIEIGWVKSDHPNVLGFLALAAGGDVELDALTLVE